MEAALYALFALSAPAAIWQFANEPAMPTYQSGQAIEQSLVAEIAS